MSANCAEGPVVTGPTALPQGVRTTFEWGVEVNDQDTGSPRPRFASTTLTGWKRIPYFHCADAW